LVCSFLLVGCAIVDEKIENIDCQYKLRNVHRADDCARIDRIINSAALGEVIKIGSPVHPEYHFTVKNLDVLDEIHPQILYEDARAESADPRRVFNYANPKFSIEYDTVDITALIEVLVRFKITSGAKLFYKPQGEPEQDITHLVDANGNVALKTKIRRGQEYIYAKVVSGKVQRHIRINVYSQAVTDIDKTEY